MTIDSNVVNFIKNNYGLIGRYQIANLLGIKDYQVKYIIDKFKLKSSFKPSTKFVNHEVFNKLTLNSCYWAGFLAADGCISGNKVSLCLSRKDSEHLLKFKSFCNLEHEIYLSKKTSNTSLTFTSPKIITNLKSKFKITSNKSLTLKPPQRLTRKQSLAFIIGYIDGDGSIGYNTHKTVKKTYTNIRLRIIGTPTFLKWINSIFRQKNIPQKHCNSKIHIISFSNKNLLSNLYNFTEKNNLPILIRKWDKLKDSNEKAK